MKRMLFFSTCVMFVFSFVSAVNIAAQNRKSVSGAEVTGTFRDESGGKLRVSFSGVYSYKMRNGEDMANLGEASGTADIAGDTAIFKPVNTGECTITLKFLPGGRLKVSQHGTDSQCGFGANVSASGDYKKISNARPKFTAH